MASDSPFIDATLAGDTSAFEALMRRYQDRLFRTMVNVSGSHAEAEDVVQEAFTRAFVKLDSFQGQSKFYTWLYRIAFNVYLGRKRKDRSALSLQQLSESQGIEPMDQHERAESLVARNDDVRMLRESMQSLGALPRQMLVLRELDGRTYEEIAEICEVAVGTVRSRLHRARKQLLETMKARHPDRFCTDPT